MTDKSEKAGSELAAVATFNGRATAQQGETRAKQGGGYEGGRRGQKLLVKYQVFLSEKKGRAFVVFFVFIFSDQKDG